LKVNVNLAVQWPMTPPEPDWLRQAQGGDAGAFAHIVRAHQARVFSLALRLCRRREDAEEVAQDAFVQLHAALDRITDGAHLKHWLLRTVTHRAIDRARAQNRRPAQVALEVVAEPAAPETEEDPLAQRQLLALIDALQPDARAVLLLRFQEDLDPLEISRVLEIPHNTVKSHLRRALESLRAADRRWT
jgi:RNA polymerase sigma-70 factor (ECF subfamily)